MHVRPLGIGQMSGELDGERDWTNAGGGRHRRGDVGLGLRPGRPWRVFPAQRSGARIVAEPPRARAPRTRPKQGTANLGTANQAKARYRKTGHREPSQSKVPQTGPKQGTANQGHPARSRRIYLAPPKRRRERHRGGEPFSWHGCISAAGVVFVTDGDPATARRMTLPRSAAPRFAAPRFPGAGADAAAASAPGIETRKKAASRAAFRRASGAPYLNRSFTRSVQLLEFGECLSPPLRSDSSSSLSSLRWCSVSLMGVSMVMWQYRSPG